jgi:hypothetical protein
MRSFANAERFTRRYTGLRGLEMVPVWGSLAFMSFAEGVGWVRDGDVFPRLLVLLPVFAVCWLIRRYLDRTFGVVHPLSAGWGWFGVGVIVYYALQFTAIATGLHVDFTGPAIGAWAASFALRDHGFRRHWLLPAAVGFLLPFVVPYPTPPSAPRPPEASLWWAILWAAFTAASVWDHLLLVRSFHDGLAE